MQLAFLRRLRKAIDHHDEDKNTVIKNQVLFA